MYRPTQIFLFMKSHHFRKCSRLIVIGYNNFHGDPRLPRPKSGGRDPQLPEIDACENHPYMCLWRDSEGSKAHLTAGNKNLCYYWKNI